MTTPRWSSLNERDRASFRAAIACLDGRLAERDTVDWALRLKQSDSISRLALLDRIDSPDGQAIGEPWLSAWRLIEECWSNPAVDRASMGAFQNQRRLHAGDRSGSLVTAIVDLVRPRLKVEPFSDMHLRFSKPPKRPRTIADVFSAGLTSGDVVDLGVLRLAQVNDRDFLVSLANAVEAALTSGLDIARRVGWDGERHLWQLGQLHRVYYVPIIERQTAEHDPDQFHRGIAPSAKLLHSIVARLVDIDISTAIAFTSRWKLISSPIYLRLWAALSRDPRVTLANDVGNSLLSMNDRCFWNVHDYPEIAEMRAKRFSEIDANKQLALTDRIRKRPPRNQWPKRVDAARVDNARLYWAVRELRRIEVAGAALPESAKTWLESKIGAFPDIAQMSRLDEGFLDTAKANWVPADPDSRYDLLEGMERLGALEVALSSARGGWDDNPAGRAADWIRQQGKPVKLLADFESIPDGGTSFPKVWEQFGWAHTAPPNQGDVPTQPDPPTESARVLALLAELSVATAEQSIEGLSHWLSTWQRQIVGRPECQTVWLRLWPIAIEATNARQPAEEAVDLNTVVRSSDNREPQDLDTLNTPVGRLVDVFLAECPDLGGNGHPFDADGTPRIMRDALIAATGRARLIVRHRLIEELPYFLRADRDWAQAHLVTPLIAENSEALALWRAIARRLRASEVLKVIGGPMAERAVDLRLGRETRQSLVFSLVVESLYAFKDSHEPAVPHARMQQMLRSIDDEVRAYGADAIRRFVGDVSSAVEGNAPSPAPEELFRAAVAPFLGQVWPQERSLSTPGVSRAFAQLPAVTKGAFAEAVAAIERFLVPFDCWSMLDYGLYGEENGSTKLSLVDTQEKTAAFLQLLDRTIGTSETSVIPHDLADALEQIRKIAPATAESLIFRRLATAARRS